MVGVNKQTLLYYDKIHLFSPEYVDDMGYRYYTFTQLDCFYAIMTLKTIGMSLEEIKEYFDTRDAERTAKLLQKGILETKKKVAELVTLSREMNKRIELLEKANHVTCGKIYIEHHETQYLYCTKYISMDAKEIERQEIYGKMIGYRVLHQLHCGPAIGGLVENKFLMKILRMVNTWKNQRETIWFCIIRERMILPIRRIPRYWNMGENIIFGWESFLMRKALLMRCLRIIRIIT